MKLQRVALLIAHVLLLRERSKPHFGADSRQFSEGAPRLALMIATIAPGSEKMLMDLVTIRAKARIPLVAKTIWTTALGLTILFLLVCNRRKPLTTS
ncbi:hypothetical protein [Roseovarius tolerans]|uniref:hypothetical protein n=1 Tax=Roseovarius tolerans TaxID=74031 RepID=UPI000B775BC1|nr:hypothetical protein [Roseovarius tolerans]